MYHAGACYHLSHIDSIQVISYANMFSLEFLGISIIVLEDHIFSLTAFRVCYSIVILAYEEEILKVSIYE